MAALSNYRLFGERGLQAAIGHLVEMAQLLREHLEGHEGRTVLQRRQLRHGDPLPRLSPGGGHLFHQGAEFDDPAWRESLIAGNDFNWKVLDYVHSEALEGRGVVISSTDCYRRTAYDEPIVALKSYILSPFVGERDIEAVVAKLLEAREKIGGG